uniref:SCP domain-containing protein n=1 Tax=Caenorhabditis tropicalis TaxID=1561998 RepID=A0A1I7T2Q8_9PELO
MFSKPAFVVIYSAVVAISAYSVHAPAKNTVQDAREQLHKAIRCWELNEDRNPASGYRLSEPVYELCSYMPDSKDFNKFYVNGVDMESDDYSNILAVYGGSIPGYSVLNVCLQEAFQFHAANHPSQTSMRCLCKRDGCNLPKGFTTFLDYNKLPMPEVFY